MIRLGGSAEEFQSLCQSGQGRGRPSQHAKEYIRLRRGLCWLLAFNCCRWKPVSGGSSQSKSANRRAGHHAPTLHAQRRISLKAAGDHSIFGLWIASQSTRPCAVYKKRRFPRTRSGSLAMMSSRRSAGYGHRAVPVCIRR